MEYTTQIVNGRKRIIVSIKSSGEDKAKEAILKVMGKGWKYEEGDK